MANKSMQPRHWERIEQITGHKFEVDSDNFLLKNLMQAPLLQNSEDIEVSKKKAVLCLTLVSRSFIRSLSITVTGIPVT
jgi:hypothetical protein